MVWNLIWKMQNWLIWYEKCKIDYHGNSNNLLLCLLLKILYWVSFIWIPMSRFSFTQLLFTCQFPDKFVNYELYIRLIFVKLCVLYCESRHKFHSKLELKCDLEKRSNQREISSLFQITVVWYIDCRVLFVFKILCSLWYTILGNVVSFVIFLLLFR